MANPTIGMLAKELAVVTMLLQLLSSKAAMYKVGDSVGWTTIGNFDYKQWAATKNFHVGDVIHFEYPPQFHNVMRVKHAAYRTCNASSPIATYTTGNDSITLTAHGHHYFLCGVPGHCQAGQKVDINIPRNSSSSASTPTVSSSPAVPSPTAPNPSPNGAASFCKSVGLLSKLVLVVALFLVLW